MPAIRAQLVNQPHPVTGVHGVWWQRTGDDADTWVGLSKADLRPTQQGGVIATGSGSAAQRLATYLANAQTALQEQLGSRYVLTLTLPTDGSFDIDNIEIRDA